MTLTFRQPLCKSLEELCKNYVGGVLRVRFRQALFAVMLLAARFKCRKSSVIGKFRFSGNVKSFSLVKCDMQVVNMVPLSKRL